MDNPQEQKDLPLKKTTSYKLVILFLTFFVVVAMGAIIALTGVGKDFIFPTFAVLSPKGTIAQQERHVMVVATLIMMIVIVPVLALTFLFVWKYREGKPQIKYSPEMESDLKTAALLWAVPIIIITIIGIINWKSTHALDPYKPIASNKQPIIIQVVALQWKWLFIYPDQHIATVNFFEFPEGTPLNFKLTADAPMSSFWIPQLGSQSFAMQGMQNQLHLMADHTGEFAGSATEINGAGFAGMRFTANSVTESDFNVWVKKVQSSQNPLSQEAYNNLAKPSENNKAALYSTIDNNLFYSIMMKYMAPAPNTENSTMNMNH